MLHYHVKLKIVKNHYNAIRYDSKFALEKWQTGCQFI